MKRPETALRRISGAEGSGFEPLRAYQSINSFQTYESRNRALVPFWFQPSRH